ncbi:MAG: methionine ABC transporter ATP-binding protein [Thermoprotei archaeon]|nr:MAG: methionine ABC transporter ATP-binding protein [Thermoprotei archaeon]
MEPLLQIRGLKVYFYTDEGVVHAVDGVDLDVMRGETLCVVGESGCGKSTLAYSILRLVRPPGRIVEGSILFDGVDLVKLSEEELNKIRGRRISMIFQDPTSALNPVFTVGYQVYEAIELHQRVKGDEAWKRVMSMLRRVGIPSPEVRYRDYPHQFSGGQRQRIMLAIALSCHPDLLIADEPTTNLDVTIQAQVLHLIKQLKEELGMTVMLITHDMGIVAMMADRVAVMYAGKIVEVAPVLDIYEKPLHPYTQALIKAIPLPHVDVEELQPIPGEVPSLLEPPPGCRFHPRCPYAMDVCRREEPPMIDLGEGHQVACWLHAKR